MYQRYAQAAQSGDYSQIDPNEAAGNLQQFVQNAPPDLQQQAYAEYFQQMSPQQMQQLLQALPPDVQSQLNANDPQGFAQGFGQTVQQRPDLLQRMKEHPVASIALAGLAAVAAKHILSRHGK